MGEVAGAGAGVGAGATVTAHPVHGYIAGELGSRSRAAEPPGSDAAPCGNGHEGTVANMRVSGEAPHPQTDIQYIVLEIGTARPVSLISKKTAKIFFAPLRGAAEMRGFRGDFL